MFLVAFFPPLRVLPHQAGWLLRMCLAFAIFDCSKDITKLQWQTNQGSSLLQHRNIRIYAKPTLTQLMTEESFEAICQASRKQPVKPLRGASSWLFSASLWLLLRSSWANSPGNGGKITPARRSWIATLHLMHQNTNRTSATTDYDNLLIRLIDI